MPDLTFQNIAQISSDVRRQEITFAHLADELIDHICCDVEQEMQRGLNFAEAYRKVNEKMGERRLKEIQEETLYAVDNKYRKMKNTMKISGIAGTVLLGFAALFKIMHWPGAGIMMALGGLSLAFIFMPSTLVVLWKESHSNRRLFLYISAFFAAMLFIMGTVFKIQHWPGAGRIMLLATLTAVVCFIPSMLMSRLREQKNAQKKIIYILGAAGVVFYVLGVFLKIQHWPGSAMLIWAGLVAIFFIVFPWYTFVTFREEKNISSKFLFMVIGSLAIVIPSALISMNLQRSYEAGFYLQVNEQQALFSYLYNHNRYILDNNRDSLSASLFKQADIETNEIIKLVDEIQAKMIAEADGKPGTPAVITRQIIETQYGPQIQFTELRNPFQPVPFNDLLQSGCASRIKLDKALKDYAGYLSSLSKGDDSIKIERLLYPAVYFPPVGILDKSASLMTMLHETLLLRNGILTAEAVACKAVLRHNNK
jgi:hypothetical protein